MENTQQKSSVKMGLCHTPTTLLILEIITTNWKKTTTWLAYCHLHSWGIKTLHRGLFPPLTNSTQHWASAPSRFSQYPTSRLKGYLSICENLGALGSDFCSAILSAWYPIEQYLFQTSFETCHHTTWGNHAQHSDFGSLMLLTGLCIPMALEEDHSSVQKQEEAE